MRKSKGSSLYAPYLRRVWLDPEEVPSGQDYPFCLPFLQGLDLKFEHPICILVGENGTGKSTLLEGIAALAGYDEAGGGKGYSPVDHSAAAETMGGTLARALRAAWLPKITTGWFFRAESFFSVARYLDQAAQEVGQAGPDFLSLAWRRLSALFPGALSPPGHLSFRRTGVGAVPQAPAGLSAPTPPDGPQRPVPGDHGHPLPAADGLSPSPS